MKSRRNKRLLLTGMFTLSGDESSFETGLLSGKDKSRFGEARIVHRGIFSKRFLFNAALGCVALSSVMEKSLVLVNYLRAEV